MSEPINIRLMNILEFSRHTNYQYETIQQWIRRGCPVYKAGKARGEPTLLNMPDVLKWREDDIRRLCTSTAKPTDLNTAKSRQAIAAAQIEELELGKLANELLDAKTWTKALEGMLITFKTKLLSLPKLLGRDIDDRALRVRVEQMAERCVRECLELFANYDPLESDTDSASEDRPAGDLATPEAAPQAHAQPVGRAKAVHQHGRGRTAALAQ